MRGPIVVTLVVLVAACGSSKKSEPEDEGSSAKKAGGAACSIPEGGEITKSLTLPGDCSLTVGSIAVKEKATLTLEAGAKLAFSAGAELHVYDGKLLVKGSEKSPVVFTSAGDKKPGAWKGVHVDPGGGPGSVIDHAIIEYAGEQTPISHAGLTVYESVKPELVVTASVFRNNGGAGLRGAWLAKVEGNTFEKNSGISIETSAGGLGNVKKNKADEPIHVTSEALTTNATWPSTGVPIVLDGAVSVNGETTPAVLTIEPGATVKIGGGAAIEVGKGALAAKGVTFTSSATTPAEGDWRGLFFAGGAGSVIDGCTIEYAGAENAIGPGAGVILYETPELGNEVKVTATTFRKNKFGGIRGKGCEKAEAAGNKSEGAPLCAP